MQIASSATFNIPIIQLRSARHKNIMPIGKRSLVLSEIRLFHKVTSARVAEKCSLKLHKKKSFGQKYVGNGRPCILH